MKGALATSKIDDGLRRAIIKCVSFERPVLSVSFERPVRGIYF